MTDNLVAELRALAEIMTTVTHNTPPISKLLTRAADALEPSGDVVERVAQAIEAAQCPGREGPFGGYDYGHPDDKPVDGGRYVIRDFRDPKSPDWGKWIHQTDDNDEHEAMFTTMTRRHIAIAALGASHAE